MLGKYCSFPFIGLKIVDSFPSASKRKKVELSWN